MNSKYIYKCVYCEESLNGCTKYVFHMKKYGTEKIQRFKCPFCGSTLSSGKTFTKHLKTHEFKGELRCFLSFKCILNRFYLLVVYFTNILIYIPQQIRTLKVKDTLNNITNNVSQLANIN